MTLLITTIIITFMVFLMFCVGLTIGAAFGIYRKRRCACAASREVMKKFEAREKAKKEAFHYSPQSVNPSNLPIIPDELKK